MPQQGRRRKMGSTTATVTPMPLPTVQTGSEQSRHSSTAKTIQRRKIKEDDKGLLKDKIPRSNNSINSIILAKCRKGEWQQGYQLLQQYSSGGHNDLPIIHDDEGNSTGEGNVNSAVSVEKDRQHQEHPVRRNVEMIKLQVYDAILRGMAKDGHWKDALKLLASMRQGADLLCMRSKDECTNDKMVESTATRTDATARQQQWRYPKPALSTYHAVLEALSVASQPEQAVQLLLSMPSHGVKVSRIRS